ALPRLLPGARQRVVPSTGARRRWWTQRFLNPRELAMIKNLLERWPLIRQIRTGTDGTGPEVMSRRTENLLPKHHDAEFTRSICPYCGVGCGQMIFHKDGEMISIEGDPGSPISRGHLCPKGADTFELHTHPGRLMTVKYRRPYATTWEKL